MGKSNVSKLSHSLLDLGFICALGMVEIPHAKPILSNVYAYILRRDSPLRWDENNGVVVIYDKEGRPWIMTSKLIKEKDIDYKIGKLISDHHVKRGAFVPFSNDGGWFVGSILPTL